jgi:hypothetical protein
MPWKKPSMVVQGLGAVHLRKSLRKSMLRCRFSIAGISDRFSFILMLAIVSNFSTQIIDIHVDNDLFSDTVTVLEGFAYKSSENLQPR